MVCERWGKGSPPRAYPVLILVLMEYGLRGDGDRSPILQHPYVLILVLMEYGLRAGYASPEGNASYNVLILVLMEYGL